MGDGWGDTMNVKYTIIGAYRGDFSGEPSLTADTVIESDRAPRDTGLVDQYGNKIYSVEEHPEVGFRPERWRNFK